MYTAEKTMNGAAQTYICTTLELDSARLRKNHGLGQNK